MRHIECDESFWVRLGWLCVRLSAEVSAGLQQGALVHAQHAALEMQAVINFLCPFG